MCMVTIHVIMLLYIHTCITYYISYHDCLCIYLYSNKHMYTFSHTYIHTCVYTEGDRSLGMVIVSGKVRNKDGSTVEGIFIQKILPGSLTDKDGRYIHMYLLYMFII